MELSATVCGVGDNKEYITKVKEERRKRRGMVEKNGRRGREGGTWEKDEAQEVESRNRDEGVKEWDE